MKTLEAFHIRCQQQILNIRWWAHVSNVEVLQRSGLSTIGDILSHRRLSLFGHVARLDPGVPAHDALHVMVDTYEGRKPMASWRRPPGRPRNVWLNNVQEDANAIPLSTLWRSAITRGHGVAQWSTGLCDDDDDDDDDPSYCIDSHFLRPFMLCTSLVKARMCLLISATFLKPFWPVVLADAATSD